MEPSSSDRAKAATPNATEMITNNSNNSCIVTTGGAGTFNDHRIQIAGAGCITVSIKDRVAKKRGVYVEKKCCEATDLTESIPPIVPIFVKETAPRSRFSRRSAGGSILSVDQTSPIKGEHIKDPPLCPIKPESVLSRSTAGSRSTDQTLSIKCSKPKRQKILPPTSKTLASIKAHISRYQADIVNNEKHIQKSKVKPQIKKCSNNITESESYPQEQCIICEKVKSHYEDLEKDIPDGEQDSLVQITYFNQSDHESEFEVNTYSNVDEVDSYFMIYSDSDKEEGTTFKTVASSADHNSVIDEHNEKQEEPSLIRTDIDVKGSSSTFSKNAKQLHETEKVAKKLQFVDCGNDDKEKVKQTVHLLDYQSQKRKPMNHQREERKLMSIAHKKKQINSFFKSNIPSVKTTFQRSTIQSRYQMPKTRSTGNRQNQFFEDTSYNSNRPRLSMKMIKRKLMRILKRELNEDDDESQVKPQSMYQALKIIARSKKSGIAFRKNEGVGKKLNSSRSFKQKKGIVHQNPETCDFANLINKATKKLVQSHHSIEVEDYIENDKLLTIEKATSHEYVDIRYNDDGCKDVTELFSNMNKIIYKDSIQAITRSDMIFSKKTSCSDEFISMDSSTHYLNYDRQYSNESIMIYMADVQSSKSN